VIDALAPVRRRFALTFLTNPKQKGVPDVLPGRFLSRCHAGSELRVSAGVSLPAIAVARQNERVQVILGADGRRLPFMRPHPHWIDYSIIGIYFTFVLGIGFVLKKYMKTSTDFFLSGRSIPAWITGLAFLSANLGAQEVIGMGASGAKYGIMTSHFYWVGAIPAMVFVGLFMMPFYYGSRARSVPEYLKLRF